jgi:hypothetical protein
VSSSYQLPIPTPPNGAYTWPVKRRAMYSTIIQTPSSQRGETRFPLMVYPRWQFELDFNYIKGDTGNDASAMGALVAFYTAMQGAAWDWLYVDPYDNTILSADGVLFSLDAPGTVASGDGSTTSFQLGRMIGGIGADIIQNPDLADDFTVTVNETPTSVVTGPTGIVTFDDPPADGAIFTWAGNFFFRCRFVEDEWESLQMNLPEIWELKGLKFVSVIL